MSLNLIFKPLYKEERSWVVDIVERTWALESQIGAWLSAKLCDFRQPRKLSEPPYSSSESEGAVVPTF